MVRACVLRRLTAAAVVLGVAGSAGLATAQTEDAFNRTRRGGAVTTYGSPAAQLCIEKLTAGDTTDLAVTACTRALNDNLGASDRFGLLINRGILYLRRTEPALALADFDAAIAQNRRAGEAHANRGAALIALGQNGPAIAALTEALGLGVQEPQKAYLNRGIAREALGDERGALEDYTTALDIEPGWTAANEELARIARAHQAHLAAMLAEDAAP